MNKKSDHEKMHEESHQKHDIRKPNNKSSRVAAQDYSKLDKYDNGWLWLR